MEEEKKKGEEKRKVLHEQTNSQSTPTSLPEQPATPHQHQKLQTEKQQWHHGTELADTPAPCRSNGTVAQACRYVSPGTPGQRTFWK